MVLWMGEGGVWSVGGQDQGIHCEKRVLVKLLAG